MRLRLPNPQRVEPWQILVPVGALALAGGASWLTMRLLSGGLPPGVEPPQPFQGVPFASGGRPVWPVVTTHPERGVVSYRDVHGQIHGRAARRFGAPRGDRYHVGVDLFARPFDPVVAMESGVVLQVQTFHLGTNAMLVQHGDKVVLYGEIDQGSNTEFGVGEGSSVSKGQPIARVGCMDWDGNVCESHMLHLETYACCPTQNIKWYAGSPPPALLLDPTKYLLRASARA